MIEIEINLKGVPLMCYGLLLYHLVTILLNLAPRYKIQAFFIPKNAVFP